MSRSESTTILRLLENEISNMMDNLYRLSLAARVHPMDALYGQSGMTLQQIKEGYDKRLAEVMRARESFLANLSLSGDE